MSRDEIMANLVKSGIDAYNMGYEQGKAEVMAKVDEVLEEIESEHIKCVGSEAYGNSFGLATAEEIIRRHFKRG